MWSLEGIGDLGSWILSPFHHQLDVRCRVLRLRRHLPRSFLMFWRLPLSQDM